MKIKLEAILQEADVLFSRKGYNSTSLDDISARLDITKTALYHYVKNKNELLFLVTSAPSNRPSNAITKLTRRVQPDSRRRLRTCALMQVTG